MTVPRPRRRMASRSIAAALLALTFGAAMVACTGVQGRPEGAPVGSTTDSVDPSAAARSAEAARDQAVRASAAEQSRLAAASSSSVAASSAASASSSASASAAAEAARVAAEQQAAADQARQQAEQAAADGAAAQAAEAERQAAADQAQFDAALASGTCTDAPADRVTECVGIIEDSVPPPGDAGADGASADDGSGGWYDSSGNWVSPETAARAQDQGIPVGGDVPGYLRCGTLCGEGPTSGEIQSQWLEEQGLVDENGAPTGSGG